MILDDAPVVESIDSVYYPGVVKEAKKYSFKGLRKSFEHLISQPNSSFVPIGYDSRVVTEITPFITEVAPTDFLSEGFSFKVQHRQNLVRYKTRISVKNQLNDDRNLIIRGINVHVTHYVDQEYKTTCGSGWGDPSLTWYSDSLFTTIPMLSPARYLSQGNSSEYQFIGEEKYLKLDSNGEVTFDLSFEVPKHIMKLFCLSSACGETCFNAKFLPFDKYDIAVEFIVDTPDFDDLSGKKIRYNVSNVLEIGYYELTQN